MEYVKICPSCKGEFRPDIEHCVSCEVDLGPAVLEGGADGAYANVPLGFATPPARHLLPDGEPAVPVAFAENLEEVTESLIAGGLLFRFKEQARKQTHMEEAARIIWAVQVRESDWTKARELLAERFQGSWEAFSECPACQTKLPDGAHDCASCGLHFPEDDITQPLDLT